MKLLSLPIERSISLKDERGRHYRCVQSKTIEVAKTRTVCGEIRYDVRLTSDSGECLWWTNRVAEDEAERVALQWRDEVERLGIGFPC